MLGTRTAIFALLCLYVSGMASLASVALKDIHQQSQQDLAEISQQLQQMLDSEQPPVESVEALTRRFPVQYALVEDRSDSSQQSFGEFALPSHPLTFLARFNEPALVFDTRWQLTDIHLELASDHYLEQATAPLLRPATLFSGIFLCALLLIFSRGLSIRRHLGALHSAIRRMSSLENASAIAAVGGKLKPLADDLNTATETLRKRIGTMSQQEAPVAEVAAVDPVTNLNTRPIFDRDLALPSDKEGSKGYVILLRAQALSEINLRGGKHDGDCYLMAIGKLLRRYEDQFGTAYRYRPTDFLLRLPEIARTELDVILNEMVYHLQDIARNHDVSCAGVMGAVPYQRKDDPKHLMASLDTVASVADTEGAHSFIVLDHAGPQPDMEARRWQAIVDDVIDNCRIAFIQQPIKPCSENTQLYTELLVRFTTDEGTPMPTESLLAMAAKQGRVTDIDKLIITRLLRHLSQHTENRGSYGINLASHSFTDAPFIDWLERQLTDNPKLAGRLVFEISERSIQINPDRAALCVERLHKHGARICIDRFGSALTSFRFFQRLKPDFIKLEPGLTKGIDTNTNNRFFVRMLSDIAIRMEVKVIASHVEIQDEKAALQALRVDGMQGMFIAVPSPLVVK